MTVYLCDSWQYKTYASCRGDTSDTGIERVVLRSPIDHQGVCVTLNSPIAGPVIDPWHYNVEVVDSTSIQQKVALYNSCQFLQCPPFARACRSQGFKGQPECVCRAQPAAALHLPKARATLATAVYAEGMVMCFRPRGILGSTTEANSMQSSEAPAASWADGVGVVWGVGLPAAPPSLVLACSLSVGPDDGNMLVGVSGLTDWFTA